MVLSISKGLRRIGTISRGASCAAVLATCLLPVIGQAQSAPSYTISAAVGKGTAGFTGDGAAAVNAELNFPSVMTMDKSGNLYIADTLNYRIRKVDTSGNISTIAGDGTKGNSGDGKAATAAEFGGIGGIAVDGSGNIYFSDTSNHLIRKISSSGTISAFAGTGTLGFSGDTTQYTIPGSTVVVATNAKVSGPTGIAVDSKGNVYFSDSGNNRIRRVSVTDSSISTIAGDGTGAYYGDGAGAAYSEVNHPTSLIIDAQDNIYFADSLNHRVRKIAAADGKITTVAGIGYAGKNDNGGLAVNAELHYPSSVSVDSPGNLYIADQINNRVRMVTTNGLIWTIAGSGRFGNTGDGGAALSASMYFPSGVQVDSAGKVYVIDNVNNRIRLLTPQAGSVPPAVVRPGDQPIRRGH
jgi:sugar lactone lactonase YvrE